MSLAAPRAVVLPGGFEVGGAWRRRVELLPLTGDDEAFLLEALAGVSAARRSSMLLGRMVALDGASEPLGADWAAALSVGDREALLLHLRRATFGERMQALLPCPACGERLDLDLGVSELLVSSPSRRGGEHEAEIEAEGAHYRVRFRLPTGADQEWAAELAATDPDAAAEGVLARCVLAVVDGEGASLESVPPLLAEALADRMASLDPQAEIDLGASCPACGEAFSSLLDAGQYFFQELAQHGGELWREVHLLAWFYHWSERDILALPFAKRRRYLRMVLAEADLGELR